MRNINFALNSEHVRDTVPTPKSGDKKRKMSELSPVHEVDADAMDLESALPDADPDALSQELEAPTRRSKRSRKGSPVDAKQSPAAAVEAAGRSTRSAAAEDTTLSVRNIPVFKDDHLASMVDAVLEEEEEQKKLTVRATICAS